MSDQVFPAPFLLYGYHEGIEHSTDIISTHGGHEFRNRRWKNGRRVFRVPLGEFSQANRDALLAFVSSHGGTADSFLFQPPHGGAQVRVRFRRDRAEIEERFFELHYWPDVELIEVRS